MPYLNNLVPYAPFTVGLQPILFARKDTLIPKLFFIFILSFVLSYKVPIQGSLGSDFALCQTTNDQ
jgi:hypothetical protein